MVYACFSPGLRLVYAWFTHGLRTVYAWFTHGLRSLRNVLQFAQLIRGFVQFAQFAQFAHFGNSFSPQPRILDRLDRESCFAELRISHVCVFMYEYSCFICLLHDVT